MGKKIMEKRLQDYFELIKMRPELFLESDLITIETEEECILQYEKETGKQVGVLYCSQYNTLVVDLIRNKDGSHYTYERVIPTVEQGAVVILTKFQDRYVLLKQYRHALRDYQYACPRGFGEQELSAAENLEKEIREEIGAQVLSYEHLGAVVADSGLCGNKVDAFICTVDYVEEKQGYEGIERVVMLNQEEMDQWIREGKITDGFTLSAYSLYKAQCNKL